MKNFTKMLLVVLIAFSFNMMAQQKIPAGKSGVMGAPTVVPSIAQQIADGTIKYADNTPQLGRAKGHSGPNIVPGKGSSGEDPLIAAQELSRSQGVNMTQTRAPITTFVADISSSTPSDPTGAAGPNHYVAAWNIAFRIFDKDGVALTDELSLGTLFPGNTIGDPIVFFDANVDNGPGEPRGRFIITEFDSNPNGFNFAVSSGPDPVNDEWYIYTDDLGTGNFPDYTKFAVWGDSYIVTANINNQENRVFAVERNQMLQNLPAQFAAFPLPSIVTNGFYSPHGFHTTGDEAVPAGTPAPIVYMQDDAWGGVDDDHLKIWEATLDWANPANHSIELAQEITTADFVGVFDGGSFSNIPQTGGPDVDALQATMMQQVGYRRFANHNSVVMNFVVDVSDPGEKAGIRWFELRQTADGEPWTIFQEGTYVTPGKRSAFQGSMVMDSQGNIAMGYISSSEDDPIRMHYTGRFDGDPLGVMTVYEQVLFESSAACPTDRLADYTQLTLDPEDESFWFISEQFDASRRDIVSNFTLDAAQPDDLSMFSIITPVGEGEYTANEDITVTIRNYGSNAITDPTVQYTIDSGAAVIETFIGTIEPGLSVEFTFDQSADLSEPGPYSINVATALTGDSNVENDSLVCIATNTLGLACIPVTTSGCNVDGIKQFVLGDINVDDGGDGCNTEPADSPQGYADRTDLSTDLNRADGENAHIIQARQNWTGGPNVSRFSVWIDFDDSMSFEESEQLVVGEFFTVANELEDFDLILPIDAPLGAHILRAKGIDASATGDINDPCADSQFGEVQDYTVNIVEVLAVQENVFEGTALNIVSTDNNQFSINVLTPFEGRAAISVFNALGQRLAHNNIRKEGNLYSYELDMSYAASGMYIVQFTDIDGGSKLVEKIVVN